MKKFSFQKQDFSIFLEFLIPFLLFVGFTILIKIFLPNCWKNALLENPAAMTNLFEQYTIAAPVTVGLFSIATAFDSKVFKIDQNTAQNQFDVLPYWLIGFGMSVTFWTGFLWTNYVIDVFSLLPAFVLALFASLYSDTDRWSGDVKASTWMMLIGGIAGAFLWNQYLRISYWYPLSISTIGFVMYLLTRYYYYGNELSYGRLVASAFYVVIFLGIVAIGASCAHKNSRYSYENVRTYITIKKEVDYYHNFEVNIPLPDSLYKVSSNKKLLMVGNISDPKKFTKEIKTALAKITFWYEVKIDSLTTRIPTLMSKEERIKFFDYKYQSRLGQNQTDFDLHFAK